jgi:hypothetical protein
VGCGTPLQRDARDLSSKQEFEWLSSPGTAAGEWMLEDSSCLGVLAFWRFNSPSVDLVAAMPRQVHLTFHLWQ